MVVFVRKRGVDSEALCAESHVVVLGRVELINPGSGCRV